MEKEGIFHQGDRMVWKCNYSNIILQQNCLLFWILKKELANHEYREPITSAVPTGEGVPFHPATAPEHTRAAGLIIRIHRTAA